jgi:hypothetical protein
VKWTGLEEFGIDISNSQFFFASNNSSLTGDLDDSGSSRFRTCPNKQDNASNRFRKKEQHIDS